jgi:hypothetical protein
MRDSAVALIQAGRDPVGEFGRRSTLVFGWTDFSGLSEEPWLRIVRPLQFGVPQFHLIP